MAREIRSDALHRCPNCKEPWTQLQNGATLDAVFKQFVEGFNLLVRNLQSKHFPGFKLTIELSDNSQIELKEKQ